MQRGFKFPLLVEVAIGALLLGLLIGVFAFIRTLRYGLSTHDSPTRGEAFLAGRIRHWSIPAELHNRTNPIPLTPAVLPHPPPHFPPPRPSCPDTNETEPHHPS